MNCALDHDRKTATLVLSRTNLLALLHKLDGMGDSACTLFKDIDNGWRMIVKSEHDDQHYGDEPRGVMHPLTEAFLARQR